MYQTFYSVLCYTKTRKQKSFSMKCLQMQKPLTFSSKNDSVYAIFDDQSFNDTLANDIVSFEQLGPVLFYQAKLQL